MAYIEDLRQNSEQYTEVSRSISHTIDPYFHLFSLLQSLVYSHSLQDAEEKDDVDDLSPIHQHCSN